MTILTYDKYIKYAQNFGVPFVGMTIGKMAWGLCVRENTATTAPREMTWWIAE